MLSYEIIALIGGENYASGYWALRILSIALCGAVFGNFYNNAILVPNKKEKNFLIATLTAASVNVVLNFVFIPLWGYIGAAITTVLAEFIVMFFGIYYSKGLYTFKICIKDILSCVVGCVFIGLICALTKAFFSNYIIIIAISVAASIISYAAILILMKNRLTTTFLNILKKKFK